MANCSKSQPGVNKSVSALADFQSSVVRNIEAFTPDPSFITSSIPFIFNKGEIVDNSLTAIIGDSTYTDFTSVSIVRDIFSIAGSFTLTLRDRWREERAAWPFTPGQKVQLQVGSFPLKTAVITGFIDSVEVELTNTDREIIITGRDRTGDLVDCSADFESASEFKNLTLLQMAKKLCEPFSIDVKLETSLSGPSPAVFSDTLGEFGEAVDAKIALRPGETIFNILTDLTKEAGLLMYPDSIGNLVIFDRKSAGVIKSGVDLIQGENILSASASYDYTNRFSKYVVKGQAPGTDEFTRENVTAPKGEALDCAIERYRPQVVIAERATNNSKAKDRAKWEAATRAAASTDVQITTGGWARPDGTVWSVNELVRVSAPFIGINDDLVVNSVQFSKNISGGTLTTLGLSRRDSFVPADELTKESDPIQRPIGHEDPNDLGSYSAFLKYSKKLLDVFK